MISSEWYDGIQSKHTICEYFYDNVILRTVAQLIDTGIIVFYVHHSTLFPSQKPGASCHVALVLESCPEVNLLMIIRAGQDSLGPGSSG